MLALDGQGAAEHYDGDYTEYHDWRASRLATGSGSQVAEHAGHTNLVRAERSPITPQVEETIKESPRNTKQSTKVKKDARPGEPASSSVKIIKKKKVDSRTPESLESEIAEAERSLSQISQQMGQPEIARDATRLIQLNDEYQQTEARLQALYAEWDRAAADAPKV
jgi:hypothetical protein